MVSFDVQVMPYVRLKITENVTHFENGIDYQILKTIQSRLNFSVRVIDCNRVWGHELPNKSWDGIMGVLQRNVSFLYSKLDKSSAYQYSKLILASPKSH